MRKTAAILLAAASLALPAAALAQADAPVAGAKPAASTYRISPGDQLQIYV